MTIPRWTVYPALVVIVGLIVIAIPSRSDDDPYAGTASSKERQGIAAERNPRNKEVVVLGIDGMDPDILAEVIRLYPERMPNFRWLVGVADGIQSLGTSTPPQSPVAWSNFITGLDPGGHGIFDFIHRDTMHRRVASSVTVDDPLRVLDLPGQWQLPVGGGDAGSNRTGEAFWSILQRHGVPADLWRMPINYPVEGSDGVSFPGMMTPALDSAYGECSFYTTDALTDARFDYEKVELVTEYDGKIIASLKGPSNVFKDGEPHEYAAFTLYVDREAEAVAILLGDETVVLSPGEWSSFLKIDFDMLPLSMQSMSGICRFYLRSIEPELELYVSPVDFDPENPAAPVSEPSKASAELAEGIGRYYTQGMAEDVNALKNGVLGDAEFMEQAELVYLERREMLDFALDRYVADDSGGLLFFYFSTVDLCSHMMWRHYDTSHPAHDAGLAAADSSEWSGRPGSTWKDTVHDLYMRMDPVLGRIRERLGDDVVLIVMSDHGFAPYRRQFNLNTWLFDNGYLVLKDGESKELPDGAEEKKQVYIFGGAVDWSKTRAYGMGFNGLYLNLAGREQDDPDTEENESGIVQPGPEAQALLRELKEKLEAEIDEDTGLRPVLRCDLATDIYHGPRVGEAPDLLVGYNAGYGNSDAASSGRIENQILVDNTGGTFNGSHLMAPEVVAGLLLTNQSVREGEHRLEDLTVEILEQYGLTKTEEMQGHSVLD